MVVDTRQLWPSLIPDASHLKQRCSALLGQTDILGSPGQVRELFAYFLVKGYKFPRTQDFQTKVQTWSMR